MHKYRIDGNRMISSRHTPIQMLLDRSEGVILASRESVKKMDERVELCERVKS